MQVVLWLALQDGAALLKESAEALQQYDAVALSAECGDLKLSGILKKPMLARVEQMRGKASTLVVIDEKDVWTYDPKANEYLQVSRPRVLAALGGNTGLEILALAYFDPAFAENALRGAKDVKVSEDGLTASWTRGATAMSFTVEERTRLPARATIGKLAYVVTRIEPEPEIGGKTFVFEIPEGAKRRKLFDDKLLGTGAEAPGFELQTLDGKAAKLSDYRGKVVLLNFWFYD